MNALPWLAGAGALGVGAYLWSQRDHEHLDEAEALRPGEPLQGRWVWPLGIWNGRRPEISDGFNGKRRSASGGLIMHGGVDLMYRRRPGDVWHAGSPNGSAGYVMPEHRAMLAASDGLVWSASSTPRGWSVVIDHAPRRLATYYTHMSELFVVPKQTVRAGQPIGVVGFDPMDAAKLKHVHLEVWHGGPSDRFDPEPFMKSWEQLPDPGDLPQAVAALDTRKQG